MRTILVGSLLLGAVGLAWAQRASDPVVSVRDGHYQSGETKIEVLGVCYITPDTVTAWDLSGKASSDLADVGRFLLQKSSSSVSVEFGKKNRWAILRTNVSITRIQQPYSWLALGPRLQYYLVRVDDTSDGSLSLSYSVADAPVVARLQKGKVVRLQHTELTFLNVKRVPKTSPKKWQYDLSVQPPVADSYLWRFTPLDDQLFPITSVDKRGRAVSTARWIASFSDTENPGTGRVTVPFHQAQFYCEMAQPPEMVRILSTFEPRSVKYLSIVTSRSIIVKFCELPMDPRG